MVSQGVDCIVPVMDYEIRRSERHCARTGRELAPGEEFYSVLTRAGAELVRQDFATDAWQGPPENAVGWWKARVPAPDAKRMHWAPNDVILGLFDELAGQPEQADLRYVLALLLIRRRVMRLEETQQGDEGETMLLYCARREAEYRVAAAPPSDDRVKAIQEELARLLFANAT
jgi:hypothetical protein